MLTLIVPGLVWPRRALTDLTFDLPLPAFRRLVGRGRVTRRAAATVHGELAARAGLAGPLPVAALRRLAAGGAPDAGEWVAIDPVHLKFAERSVVVGDPSQLELDADEAERLALSLAPIFAGLGELEVLAPLCWNLRALQPVPDFPPLTEAVGRAARPLPAERAYAAWRHALNEAQIALHAHPVNQARAAAGRPTVNSLWPWGAGTLPAHAALADSRLLADDALATGVARLAGIAAAPLPECFGPDVGDADLAIVDSLAGPAQGGDGLAWRDALSGFEAAWAAPILDALRRGRLDALCLIAPGEPATIELAVAARDLWKFWRPAQPLEQAFAAEVRP